MPQPISRVSPNANIIIGNSGDRPISRHPELAILAIEAISSWSNVEKFMLKTFVELLGGSKSLACDVYLSLQNQSAKTAAINAAADSVLRGKKELVLLKLILQLASSFSADRNKLAHWTWGESPNLPDAVLLVDPRTTIDELDKTKVFVYKDKDFKSIMLKNDKLCGWLQSFKRILTDHPANRDDELYNRLCQEPLIQEKLNRLNR